MCMAAALGMHWNFYQIRGPRFGINEQHFSNQRLSLAQKKLQYFCRLHTPDHAGNHAKHTISSRIRVSGWVLCLRTETAQTWSVRCEHGNLSRKFTDVIIPARYLNSPDGNELAKHCMEDIDKEFVNKVQKGDIIVANKNFGCGSSREHAPLAIKCAGVSCVIAETFARIFYRNSINIGLPIIECPEAAKAIAAGDEVEVDFDSGVITDKTTGQSFQGQAFPEFMQKIITAGGLVNYINQK